METLKKIKTELFEQLVYSQYDSNKKRKKPRPKGVTQIFNCINKNLSDIINCCDPIEKSSKLQIFPILVYQESCLDIEGVNFLLNKEFRKLTKEIIDSNSFIIKDLIMIPLYLLYELEDYFYNGKIKLASSINEYISQKSNSNHEMRPFAKFIIEKANRKGYRNEKTKRFQNYIDKLKEKELSKE